jgi:hypothetical protein
MVDNTNRIRGLALGDVGPEKAGVGGSIPSLATTLKLPGFINLWPLPSGIGLPQSASMEAPWESKLVAAVRFRSILLVNSRIS